MILVHHLHINLLSSLDLLVNSLRYLNLLLHLLGLILSSILPQIVEVNSFFLDISFDQLLAFSSVGLVPDTLQDVCFAFLDL